MTEEFLKELTELSRKYNIILYGEGVYYGFGIKIIEKAGNGFYQITPENDNLLEWINTT